MSEKEQQQYKKEIGKRPLYFNKPSKDFRAWLELKTESERMFQEESLKMNKRVTNTEQINLMGKTINTRVSKRRRKNPIFQKDTTIQLNLIDFFQKQRF